MKANYHSRINLRSTIAQLEHVARNKKVQSSCGGHDQTVLKQEAHQLDEALRLLRWISK
jgi:hypothetical protein